MEQCNLYVLYGRKQLYPRNTGQTYRHRLPLLPQQSYGYYPYQPELKKWVDYALDNDTLILFDAAYEAFIQEDDVPHSIYEIKGAKKCAIEFRSFSKTAGFTGVRCGYMVIPKEVTAATLEGKRIPLNKLWLRRQSTKFNGVSYITQRGAEAIYTPEGKEQVKAMVQYYMDNARIMKKMLSKTGIQFFWRRKRSVSMDKSTGQPDFLEVLRQTSVRSTSVSTPGVGFGPSGEGYVRLTSFGERHQCEEGIQRICQCL